MFKPFLDVERIGKDEVDGILVGTCYVFPKLDGTNGSIWYHRSETEEYVACGSRTRELSFDKRDNFDFRTGFVGSNAPKFTGLFRNHPTWILYGEYMKPHTVKDYRDEIWNRFFVFDVFDSLLLKYVPYHEYKDTLDLHGIDYIPCIAQIENPSMEQLSSLRDTNGYFMKDGSIGEGIVIKNYAFRNKYGHVAQGKLVRNEFKEKFMAVKTPVSKGPNTNESTIVDLYVTRGRIDKVLAKIGDVDKKAKIPRLLETVLYELVNEELWDYLRKNKKAVIDFGVLRQFSYHKTKLMCPELFGLHIPQTQEPLLTPESIPQQEQLSSIADELVSSQESH